MQREVSSGAAFGRTDLGAWCAAVFERAGLAPAEARVAADLLVRTDARGGGTHGLSRLRIYVDKLAAGEMRAAAEPEIRTTGAHIGVDARKALGQVAGPRAVREAIALTEVQPFAICTIRGTGHLGALGVQLLAAAEAGRVALLMQTTPPLLALPGGTAPTLGNNPVAIAAPRPDGPPLVIDLACSVAARGNIILASKAGQPIPEGWALDAHGRPTTDAAAALQGALLPFGGVKGLMIAAMVELLAGSLSGAAYVGKRPAGGSAPGGVNAFLLMANPELVCGREAYLAHVGAWTAHFVEAGGAQARIPGENGFRREKAAGRDGVRLAASTVNDLSYLAAQFGLPLPERTGSSIEGGA